MSQAAHSISASVPLRFGPSVARSFGGVAAVLDAIVVTASAVAIGGLYHSLALGEQAPLGFYTAAGALAALIYISLMVSKKGYAARRAFGGDFRLGDMLSAWCLSMFGLLLAGFVTKSTATYSRASILIFFAVGITALLLARYLLARGLQWGVRERMLSLGRVLIVGTNDHIAAFEERHGAHLAGMSIEGTYVLPAKAESRFDQKALESRVLKVAVDHARRAEVDDVFLLVPWSDEDQMARCGAAFVTVPARVQFASQSVLDRFGGLEVERNCGFSTLSVARGPMQLAEVISKRLLDIAVASIAIVLLSPVLIATAIAIRLDSPGPVLFRQRRNGFNQDSFEILKFRSMTVTEAGTEARQATRNDPRVTRVGRFLRKSSIDELPQLFNVLMGSMSIVGPRPHPTNLDEKFEPKIALYARRHNVKPGITGWAQVNGLRGETDTDEKMRARVDYDLYYIEHWSLGFDIYIMARTVFSPRTFANAY